MKYRLFKQLPKTSKEPICGTFDIADGVAYLFQGMQLVASIEKPEIVFVNAQGIMLKGYEPNGFDKMGRKITKYQEWFLIYDEAK